MAGILSEAFKPQNMAAGLIAVAAAASVVTVLMPLMNSDSLGKRMKSVGSERERIRQREREKMGLDGSGKPSLRGETKAYIRSTVEKLSLDKWLGADTAKKKLSMAGFRGPQAEMAFLFFRLVTPIALCLFTALYVFVIIQWDRPTMVKLLVVAVALYGGFKAPEVFLANAIGKRQQSMQRAFPNTLDLMLICVEAGMSIEHAFRKVSQEVGVESIPMAEELTLTTAEVSYLPDRRSAYENLAARTGLDCMKSLATVLTQAERYGTPLGGALRVLAQESRDQRMNDAEKKAAALPPKLTIPMILFFIPVLMAAILTPAAIQVFGWS
jgi:tight adherence protein C